MLQSLSNFGFKVDSNLSLVGDSISKSQTFSESVGKAIIGVDYRDGYVTSIDLLRQLGLDKLQITLLHGCGSQSKDSLSHENAERLGGAFDSVFEREASRLLHNAYLKTQGNFPGITTVLSREVASKALNDEAMQMEADLMVVAPTVRSNAIKAVGSVSQYIVEHAQKSVLLARPSKFSGVGFHAVYAMDQSPYALKCFTEFMKLAPKGITHLTVVTASQYAQPVGRQENAEDSSALSLSILNQTIITEIQTLGIKVNQVVKAGDPNDVIQEVVETGRADLLIIGAHGHSDPSSKHLGSVATRQTHERDCSVLLLKIS